MTRVPKFRAWDKADEDMANDVFFAWQDCGYESLNECLADDRWLFMQSTGLKDKNGVELFEGDIVTGLDYDLDPLKGKIVYKYGCFLIESEEGDFIISNDAEIEVIGNVYENKELLDD